jgi:hypothetical protein
LTGESDALWWSGAVVAVTFGMLASFDADGEVAFDGSDSFQKAVGKVM